MNMYEGKGERFSYSFTLNYFSSCWFKPLQTVWIQIRPDNMSGLIWIQTFWHSDGIPDFKKNQNLKKKFVPQYAKR